MEGSMQEKITVLIPHNQKHIKYITSAVNSVPDNVKVQVIYDAHGEGKWKILNRVILNIDSEWIALLDADDIYTINRFGLVEKYMVNSDLIYTDCIGKNKHGILNYCQSRNFNINEFKKVNFIPFSTVMVRTEIAKSIPFIDHLGVKFRALDYVWLYKVNKFYKRFTYVPGATVIRRTDTSNFQSNIPIWRKLHRLYYKYKTRKMICDMD